jgi:ABC-2 type transport system ATP-binding protein
VATQAISVRHLSHRFGTREVLTDISFDVLQGEVFGFIGPNGAGKTTTIRAMTTLLEPSLGSVHICGIDVRLEPGAVRRKIGYMPDQSGVYPKLKVREYLEFFAACYHLPPLAAAASVLELTGMSELSDELCGRLSKGMRQRLQLAKTLLHDPEVLILDEPASDLDPRARIEMRDLFVELARRGKTVFLSSHILTELSDVCTSVAILDHGRLLAAGPIQEIAQRLESQGERRDGADNAAASAERHRVKIRTLGEAERAAWLLQSMAEVEAAHAHGEVVIVSLRGDERTLALAVRQLVLADIPVIGVEPERNELESVFLGMTTRNAS